MTQLTSYFYDTKTGFRSLNDLIEYGRREGIPRKDVIQWYEEQMINQMNKKSKRVYHPIVAHEDGEFQADLMFYENYSKWNRGYIGLLNVIEITSRMAYGEPIKSKEASEIKNAMIKILDRVGKIVSLTVDYGSEFQGSFKKMIEDRGIKYYQIKTENNKTALGKIERFNRTIRILIEKYMEVYKTWNYVDVIQDLYKNYNTRKHRSIGKAPSEMNKEDRKEEREKNLENEAVEKFKEFNIGDRVRVMFKKGMWEKGTEQFSKNIYEIDSIEGYSFYLKNKKGEKLKTPFKHYHLLKTNGNVGIEVEKKRPSKSSAKKQKTFEQLQNREFRPGHEVERIENGNVIYKDRMKAKNPTRRPGAVVRKKP